MQQYEDFMRHVYENGTLKTDRTGTGTRSVFGYQMRFDLAKGFPLVTTKKLHTKSIFIELLWFLRGDNNAKWLQERGVSIWNEWAGPDGDLDAFAGLLSLDGDWLWARRFRGPQDTHLYAVAQRADGGLVAAGGINSAPQYCGVVGHESERPTLDTHQGGDQARGKVPTKLNNRVVVCQCIDHAADIIHPKAVFRYQVPEQTLVLNAPF